MNQLPHHCLLIRLISMDELVRGSWQHLEPRTHELGGDLDLVFTVGRLSNIKDTHVFILAHLVTKERQQRLTWLLSCVAHTAVNILLLIGQLAAL